MQMQVHAAADACLRALFEVVMRHKVNPILQCKSFHERLTPYLIVCRLAESKPHLVTATPSIWVRARPGLGWAVAGNAGMLRFPCHVFS